VEAVPLAVDEGWRSAGEFVKKKGASFLFSFFGISPDEAQTYTLS
jgi:hypothetical protein